MAKLAKEARRQILAYVILAGLILTLPSSLKATATATVQLPNWPAWKGYMFQIPAPKAGCFKATYPSTVWQSTQCGTAPSLPLLPSVPSTVGDGNDEVAQAPSGPPIGSAVGSFQSISGLVSETDSLFGANEFGLQVNSQFFAGVSTPYTDRKSTTGWEQFVFANDPSVGYGTQIFIQYWLIGYQSQYKSCPSTIPPLGDGWYVYSGDCYANSPSTLVPSQTASNLANLILEGSANSANSNNDEVVFCVSGGSCYTVAITDQVVNLYQHWTEAEFNVFGLGEGSQANFNSGTSITVLNTLKDQSGNVIVPSCVNTGYTGETNNLNLGSCSSNGNGQIVFTESNVPDFRLSNSGSALNLGGISVVQGSSGSITIAVSLVSGSTQAVSLSCSGAAGALPTGVSCSFNPASGSPSFTSTLTVFTSSSTPVGYYTLKVTGTAGALSRSTLFVLNVT